MKSIEIKVEVKNEEARKLLTEAKEKKEKIHQLLASGTPISEIPEDLKIRLRK
jgi:hypothetical protein